MTKGTPDVDYTRELIKTYQWNEVSQCTIIPGFFGKYPPMDDETIHLKHKTYFYAIGKLTIQVKKDE